MAKRKRPRRSSGLENTNHASRNLPQPSHPHPVLALYYRQLLPLRLYLLRNLPVASKVRRRRIASLGVSKGPDTDSHLVCLLDTTLVGVLHESPAVESRGRCRDLLAFTQSQAQAQSQSQSQSQLGSTFTQTEIVDYVIATLFNRNGYHKPQHLLTHGFVRISGAPPPPNEHEARSNIPGVLSQYPNTNVQALRQAPWTDVLELLGSNGEEIMLRLLLDCGVFPCIDHRKGVFYQLSGLPLSVLEPVNRGDQPAQPAQKEQSKDVQKPNSIVFPRRRALYGRPSLNARGEVRFGLKHDHALNRFSADSLVETVRLMKSIFPRQFGLHNVFTSDGTPFRQDTAETGEEIPKLPKRLRGRPVELVQQLQRRSQKCSYAELLRYYCSEESTGPWKLGPLSQSDSDPKLSASQPLITQPRLTEAPTPVSNPHADKPTIPPSKPTLTDHATPASSVSAFCRAVLQKLIPPQFFGTSQEGLSNKRTILKQVDRFIRMRRFESLNLHEVCQGLKITNIPWLAPPKVSPSSKLSQTDLQKRTKILHEFIYYLFDSILIPLIRTNFYVTESQTHRNRLFFFRHDIWRQLTEQPLGDLKSSVFEELTPDTAQRVLGRRPLGYSSLRLLPKSTGVRPIVNLRRRTWMKRDWPGRQGFYLGPSINSTVTPIYNMLNYERTRGPDALGSSLFSMGDIHPRLKEFKARLGFALPPLYFVKLDIQSCFDTIPQQKLIRLIEELVSEETYHITKHVELRPSDEFSTWTQPEPSRPGKAQRRFVGRAAPATKPQSLPDAFASGATSRRRNTVFVDTLAQREHNSEDLLDMLDEHVRNNLVRIGKKYFRQRNGIPQGSVLSSLLCNYFYAELERKVLQRFLSPEDTLLLRLVDDFLLITSNAATATHFLTTMVRGQPAYGIAVNPSKSLTNFTAAVDGIHIPQLADSTHSFPYCGNLINTHTLEIARDQDRLLDGGGGDTAAETLANALTVESARNPGRALHRKMLAGFKLHMHPMYLDTGHNSRSAVLGNLYANFVTAAMKTYRYVKALRGRDGSVDAVVVRIVKDITMLAVRLCRSRRETHPHQQVSAPAGGGSGISDIPHPTIQHLCATAFRFVLCRKQTRYAGVLRWLEMVGKTTRPRSNAAVGRIARVVRLGNERFGGWRF